MIASPGLLKTLEEATGTNQVNKELALLVVEQVNNLIYHFINIIVFMEFDVYVNCILLFKVTNTIYINWCCSSCC